MTGMAGRRSADRVMRAPVFTFIVGCPRSGTTLLRAMLDSHSDMAIPGESYFVVGMGRARRRYESPSGVVMDNFLDDLLRDPWFGRWGMPAQPVRDALVERRPASLAEAIRTVFAAYASARGKTRYGDKTPNYVLRMPLLADLFPEARFVHVIRDGRDVALSLMHADFGVKNAAEAALTWRWHVKRGRKAGGRLGAGRYMEVRYEQLVADPESTLRGLCRFVNLQFEEGMLRYFERANEITSGFARPEVHRNLFRSPSSGLRNWKTQMAKGDLEIFEALAADLLADLGYGRGTAALRVGPFLNARHGQARWHLRRMTGRVAKVPGLILTRRSA